MRESVLHTHTHTIMPWWVGNFYYLWIHLGKNKRSAFCVFWAGKMTWCWRIANDISFVPYANSLACWLYVSFVYACVCVLPWRLIYINQIVLMVLNMNTNLRIFLAAHSHLLKFPHFEYCASSLYLFVHGFGSCSYESSTALILFYFVQLFWRHTFALHTACAMGKWSITFHSFNSRSQTNATNTKKFGNIWYDHNWHVPNIHFIAHHSRLSTEKNPMGMFFKCSFVQQEIC